MNRQDPTKYIRFLRATLPCGVSMIAIHEFIHCSDVHKYANSGGRDFFKLCELIGQTATVTLNETEWDDGIRQDESHWTTDAMIVEFVGFEFEEDYDEDGFERGGEWHPIFGVEDDHGHKARVYLKDMHLIRLA